MPRGRLPRGTVASTLSLPESMIVAEPSSLNTVVTGMNPSAASPDCTGSAPGKERPSTTIVPLFESEQTKKENVIIRAQKVEIENKNQQLQETIDELTITKVSRKAKAITLVVGITLIVAEDPIFNLVLTRIGENNYLLSILAKIIIIFMIEEIKLA